MRRLPPLLRRAWYSLNQAFRQRVTHLRITPDQFSILRWLTEGDPAGLTQRQITDLMASDPNTITSTLTRMEKAGLIVREKHEKDRRAHRVRALPAGEQAFRDAQKIAIVLQKQVLSALPDDRREQFLRDLEVVADSCLTALEKPTSKPRKAAQSE
ncbi:MAG: MarR family winged helix-turn-helix transcriptional regulator [Chthoniobacteraceae bacterium]